MLACIGCAMPMVAGIMVFWLGVGAAVMDLAQDRLDWRKRRWMIPVLVFLLLPLWGLFFVAAIATMGYSIIWGWLKRRR